LKKEAEFGPVVVINVAESRCDALVLEDQDSDRPRLIPLPTLSYAGIKEMQLSLRVYISNPTGRSTRHIRQDLEPTGMSTQSILSMLYTTTVYPILEVLSLTVSNTYPSMCIC